MLKRIETIESRKIVLTSIRQVEETKREEKRRAKEAFCDMILSHRSIHSATPYSEAVKYWVKDARYLAISDDREKKDLYEDCIKDLEVRDKESFRQILSESKELKERIEHKKAVKFDDFDNPDDPEFQILPIDMRRQVFRAYVRTVEEGVDQARENERHKEEEDARSRCKDALAQLRVMFQEVANGGKLTVNSRFGDTKEMFGDEKVYKELEDKWYSKLRDSFDDFIENDLAPQFAKDRALLKAASQRVK